MIAVKPVSVTDSILISTIAEPDLTQGEAEWVDPSSFSSFGSLTDSYSKAVLAGNGFVYAFNSDADNILKIDFENKTTSVFGTTVDSFSDVVLVGDFIYCIPLNGNAVLKVDTTSDSVSALGLMPNSYNAFTVSSDGDIFGVSSTDVLKIDTATDVISTFGTLTHKYNTITLAANGCLYSLGGTSDVSDTHLCLKIDPSDNSIVEFGSYSNVIFTAALGSDGNIYGAGNTGAIININIADDSLTTYSSSTGAYLSSKSYGDVIYFVAFGGQLLEFSPLTGEKKLIGSNASSGSDGYYSNVEISADNRLIATGSASTSTGNVKIYNINSGEFDLELTSYIGVSSAFLNDDGAACSISNESVIQLNGLYNEGDQSILSDSGLVYQCEIDNATVSPLIGAASTTQSWIEVGPTNKFAMFDNAISTPTIASETITQTITPSAIITSIAGFNISGVSSINVTITVTGVGEIYNVDVDMVDNSAVIDMWTYLTEPIVNRDKFALFDIPPYSGQVITITFTGAADVSVGELVLGPQVDIGVANHGTTVELLDFSEQERNTFGVFEIVKRGKADLVKFKVTVPRNKVNYVKNQLAGFAQSPTVWAGEGGADDDPTLVMGFYESFTDTISERTTTDAVITIQGLVYDA